MTVCLQLQGIGPLPAGAGEDQQSYWLSENAFHDIVALAQSSGARLTFDGGYASDFTVVFPALQRAGLSATFFIPSSRIGQPGYLGADDIRTMHDAGMEFGTLGCAQLRWTEISNGEIAVDVARSIERLATLVHAPVRAVALPFGQCDRRVLGVLRQLGIGRIYSSFPGPETARAWLVRRDTVTADMTRQNLLAIMTREPAVAEAAIRFLKIWRTAGNAALWSA